MSDEQPNRFATDWVKIGDGPEPTSLTFIATDGADEDPDFDPNEPV